MLNQIAKACYEISRSKGFYCPQDLHTQISEAQMFEGLEPRPSFTNADLMLGKLMLIVSEMGEYLVAENRGNAAEELADASIRIFHICGAMDLNLNSLWHQAWEQWPPNSANTYAPPQGVMSQFLIHISEAAEACRHQNAGGFALRLAAAFNAIGQIASDRGFDLKAAVDEKMEVNRNRPFLHGKKSAT
jgi:NTP pyrophosphatase (non-canonical NTP hydrolase)